jgi:hypothetical protein
MLKTKPHIYNIKVLRGLKQVSLLEIMCCCGNGIITGHLRKETYNYMLYVKDCIKNAKILKLNFFESYKSVVFSI